MNSEYLRKIKPKWSAADSYFINPALVDRKARAARHLDQYAKVSKCGQFNGHKA